jgi:hypothetical protein
MPSFEGTERILLQPTTSGIAYGFEFEVSTSNSSCDGFLPYGTTISGVAVTALTKSTGVDVSSDIIVGTPGIDDTKTIVSVAVKYPSTNGPGWYTLRFTLTLSDGSTEEGDFNRIKAEDL